jgi:hypothetical protein
MWIECLTSPAILQADPVVLPLLILGTLASAGSQIASGVQAKKQASKNKRRLREQANEETALRRRRSLLLMGQQRSMFAAGGVDLSSPSAVDVLSATASFEEMAAQRAGSAYRYEADAQGFRGSQAFGAGLMGAGSTILSGASMFVKQGYLGATDTPD